MAYAIREIDRLERVLRQISDVEAERDEMLQPAQASSPAALLMRLKGIGAEFAGVLYLEGLFRHFENRRQLARGFYRTGPPLGLSRDLLIRALAYELQQHAHGDGSGSAA